MVAVASAPGSSILAAFDAAGGLMGGRRAWQAAVRAGLTADSREVITDLQRVMSNQSRQAVRGAHQPWLEELLQGGESLGDDVFRKFKGLFLKRLASKINAETAPEEDYRTRAALQHAYRGGLFFYRNLHTLDVLPDDGGSGGGGGSGSGGGGGAGSGGGSGSGGGGGAGVEGERLCPVCDDAFPVALLEQHANLCLDAAPAREAVGVAAMLPVEDEHEGERRGRGDCRTECAGRRLLEQGVDHKHQHQHLTDLATLAATPAVVVAPAVVVVVAPV